MIRTLRASNSSFIKLGALQVQPVTTTLSQAAKQLSTKIAAVTAPAPVPAYQAPLPIRTLIAQPIRALAQSVPIHVNLPLKQLDPGLHKLVAPSLHTIATHLTTNPHFVLPAFHTQFNVILPPYKLHLEPTHARDSHHTDELVVSPKKFEPYEQLTGISHERPEVVMMTQFLPLFVKDVSHSQPHFIHLVENSGIYPYMTDAGRFIDTHLQARQLRHVNMVQMTRALRSRYYHMSKMFQDKHRTFTKAISDLHETSSFLLQLVKGLDRLKAQLDLKDDLHIIDLRNVIHGYIYNYTAYRNAGMFNSLYDYGRLYLPPAYSVQDSLVALGFTSNNVRHNFSSTKVWLQLLLEMKDILRWQSMAFLDQDPVQQRNDNNAATLLKKNTKHFTLRESLPDLPNVSELSKIVPTQVPAAVSTLDAAFRSLYEDVHFKTDEARIAALFNLVSKEFRYSIGLFNKNVQATLRNHYGYRQQDTANVGLWDSVIGEFGNNISDVPAVEDASLTQLAQKQVGNVAVLTFESKYVVGDTGTLTPGGDYYVNQVLKTDGTTFDVSRLQTLKDRLEKSHQQFAVLVNGLNMLSQRTYDPNDKTITSYNQLLANPIDLLNRVAQQLVDRHSGNTLQAALTDNLGAVFTEANKNSVIKSILFAFTLTRLSRSYLKTVPFFHAPLSNDNTPTTDALIERLLVELRKSSPQTSAALQLLRYAPKQSSVLSIFGTGNSVAATGSSITITQDTIRSSMKGGTALTRFVEQTMGQVLAAFRYNSEALSGDHTRYGGYIDTLVLMVAFDAIVAMIAKYNNQHIIAAHTGITRYNQGITSFTVSRTRVNQRNSLNDLTVRVDREVTLTQRLVYTVFNTLSKLTGAITGYINYLKSPPAITALRRITKIVAPPNPGVDSDGDGIPDGLETLHMLMTEQQISMLATTVEDLRTALNESGAIYGTGDEDGDGDFDIDDEIKDLDHALVTPKLRNALYGLLGHEQYASRKGYNKKILTVGIPQGFTSRLHQQVNISHLKKTSFVNKQNDIVSVVVYKVDLENHDIIYKPKRFLFEMSRFPVRDQQRLLSLPERPTINDIINSIPTRDFGGSVTSGYDPVYGNLGGKQVTKGSKSAFSDESYSFLTQPQQHELLENHITSYLLEVYLKLLTGLSVADYHFDMVEPPHHVDLDFVNELMNHRAHHVVTTVGANTVSPSHTHPPTGGVLFSHTSPQRTGFVKGASTQSGQQPHLSNPSGTPGQVSHAAQAQSALPLASHTTPIEQQRVTTNIATTLADVSHRHVPLLLHDMQTVHHLAQAVTPQSDPLAVSKRLLQPKQFDRVFNVIVDPDEFEIDYDKTSRTIHGRQALDQMIQKGDIIPENENHFFAASAKRAAHLDLQAHAPMGRPFAQSRAAVNSPLFRFRDRDKNEGDLTFEKYFVVVETFGEDEV